MSTLPDKSLGVDTLGTSIKDIKKNIDNNLSSILDKKSLSAQNMINADIFNITSSLPNSISNFTKTTLDQDALLTNVNKIVADSTSKVEDSLKGISGGINKVMDSAGSMLSGVEGVTKTAEDALVFVSSTSKKAIDTISLPLGEASSSITGFASDALGKISSITGNIVNTATGAIGAVTSTVGDILDQGTKIGAQLVSTVTGTIDTVLEPIQSVIDTTLDVINPNNIQAIVKNTVGDLPFGVGDMLANKAAEGVSSLTDKLAGISSGLSSISDIDGTISRLTGGDKSFKNNNYFDSDFNITDNNGNYVKGISGTNSSLKNLGYLTNDINKLCKDLKIDFSEFSNFGDMSLMYDALIDKAMRSNAGKLLESLAKCSKYQSRNTNNIIRTNLKYSSGTGDVYSTRIAADMIGRNQITNPEKLFKTTLANGKYNTNTKSDYDDLLNNLGINDTNLYINKNYKNTKVYDAQSMIMMSNTSTKYLENKVSKNTLRNVFNVYSYYKSN